MFSLGPSVGVRMVVSVGRGRPSGSKIWSVFALLGAAMTAYHPVRGVTAADSGRVSAPYVVRETFTQDCRVDGVRDMELTRC